MEPAAYFPRGRPKPPVSYPPVCSALSQVSTVAISMMAAWILMASSFSSLGEAHQSVSGRAASHSPVPAWSLQTSAFLLDGEPEPTGNFNKASILQANGGKAAHGAVEPLLGKSVHLQKEEAEIYAPTQVHMLFIRGWHSHTWAHANMLCQDVLSLLSRLNACTVIYKG